MNPRVLALSNKVRMAYSKQVGENAPLLDNLMKSDLVMVDFLIMCQKQQNADLSKLVSELMAVLGWADLDHVKAKCVAKQGSIDNEKEKSKDDQRSGGSGAPKTYLGSLR